MRERWAQQKVKVSEMTLERPMRLKMQSYVDGDDERTFGERAPCTFRSYRRVINARGKVNRGGQGRQS
jgi:hypothetical protein